MPVKLGADGKIIEEKTEKSTSFEDEFRPAGGQTPPPTDQSSEASGAPGGSGPEQSGYEARTILARSRSAGSQGQEAAADSTTPEDKTRIYRPGAKKGQPPARSPEDSAGAVAPAASAMDDPPVGWLVVIQGPGQGNAVTIGNGLNVIGRDHGERICVDFGDGLISRHSHAIITYDPKGKTFYIQHGGGKNLTYVGDAPVLTPTELEGFSKILIGETLLLFVPLCGERFDWEEYAQ